MIVGYAHLLKVDSKKFEEIKGKGEIALRFKTDGTNCFKGDYVVIQNEDTAKDQEVFEVLHSNYDSSTSKYTVKLGHVYNKEDIILG